ncbi:MAG: hypothetical protein K8T89_04370 [Planctomycetes bacterium]|nr:hypothetical protein [Planctomycetota bacterium]
MAVILQIADAVVVELNAAVFGQPFQAVRHYLPRFELSEMNTLKVSVVPKSVISQGLDRNRDRFDYRIDVAVQKKTDLSAATLDALVNLTEEIGDFLRTQPLTAFPNARCVGVETTPIYAPEHLDEYRQFTSVLSASYSVWR